MNQFKLTPICAATLLLSNLGAPYALAQTAPDSQAAAQNPDAQTQVVEISGIRKSIRSAETIKRDSQQVVDSINADDIGKFPDRSTGDALQRIAGVQVGRDLGETNSVIIRGLPDVTTSVNGNELFTGTGRRLAYQDLPVQAVAGLDVYKSATANQFEGGIAGAVNIRLRSPFDFKGFTASGFIDAQRSKIEGSSASPTRTDPSVGGLISNRWKNDAGEFGALLDVSYTKDRWGYPVQWNDQPDRLFSVSPDGTATRLEDNQPITPLKAGDRLGNLPHVGGIYNTGDRERGSLHAALQWKPNSTLELGAQLLSTGYKSRGETDYIFSIVGWAPKISNVVLGADGPSCATKLGNICQISSAIAPPTIYDPYTATSTQAHDNRTLTNYLSFNALYREGAWRVTSDLAFTRSRFTDDTVIVDQQVPNATANVYTLGADGHGGFNAITTPTSSTPLKDARQFVLRGLVQSWGESEGSQVQWRTDADYKLGAGLFTKLMGGVRISSRKASFHGNEGHADTPNGARPVPGDIFGAEFETLVPGIDRLGGSFQTPNSDYLLDNTDKVRAYYGAAAGRVPEDPNRIFDQTERTFTAHLGTQFETEFAGVTVSGNIGTRLVKVDRTLTGKSRIGNVISDVNLDTSETNVLPSISAVVGWSERLQSHFSVGKTISRPDFSSLNPALALTPPTINAPGFGSSGNPFLKPTSSINTDATIEYYFEKNGFVQLAGFHRDIDGYLQNFTQEEVIDGKTYRVSRPQNSGKGKLYGAEFGVQKFFDFLPDPWNGFGAQFNYTWISGNNETKDSLNGNTFLSTPLINVSKSSYNVALLYEKAGLSGRLAATHRGDYAESVNTSRFGMEQTVKATTYVDLSINYEINKLMTVQFDALNLTKAKYESYLGDPARPRDIRYSPTAIRVGLRFKI